MAFASYDEILHGECSPITLSSTATPAIACPAVSPRLQSPGAYRHAPLSDEVDRLVAVQGTPMQDAQTGVSPPRLDSNSGVWSVYEREFDRLVAFAASHCPSGMAAEVDDLVADVFLAYASGEIRPPRDLADLSTYLAGVIRNRLLHAKRQFGTRKRLSYLVPRPSEPATPDVVFERKERLAQVLCAVDGLPPTQRRVLNLYIFDELSASETAERLQLSPNTVREHLRRARRRLRARTA
jgi:RNA polymerase sigma factor (sigma-70 family)